MFYVSRNRNRKKSLGGCYGQRPFVSWRHWRKMSLTNLVFVVFWKTLTKPIIQEKREEIQTFFPFLLNFPFHYSDDELLPKQPTGKQKRRRRSWKTLSQSKNCHGQRTTKDWFQERRQSDLPHPDPSGRHWDRSHVLVQLGRESGMHRRGSQRTARWPTGTVAPLSFSMLFISPLTSFELFVRFVSSENEYYSSFFPFFAFPVISNAGMSSRHTHSQTVSNPPIIDHFSQDNACNWSVLIYIALLYTFRILISNSFEISFLSFKNLKWRFMVLVLTSD